MLLGDLFDGFLEDCRISRKERTVRQHEDNIKMTIALVLGQREFSSLRPVDARKLASIGSGRGISMGRSVVITLRRILRYAKDCGHQLPCDIDDLELPVPKRLRDLEVLTAEEVWTVRRAIDGRTRNFSKHLPMDDRPRVEFAMVRTLAMFDFLLATGLRLSEALSVDRTQIDFETQELRVEDVKSDRYRSEKRWKTVYIHGAGESLTRYLRMRTDDEPALFVSTGGNRMPYQAAQSMLKRVKKWAGIRKNLTHRIFRSTFITTLLQNGLDPKEVQRLAGHRSLHMTLNYYYRIDDETLKPKHAAVMGTVFAGQSTDKFPSSQRTGYPNPQICRETTSTKRKSPKLSRSKSVVFRSAKLHA